MTYPDLVVTLPHALNPGCSRTPRCFNSIQLVLLLVLVVALAAVVHQNPVLRQVRFLWLNGEVPGIILLFLTATAGFIAGLSVALLVKRGAKP